MALTRALLVIALALASGAAFSQEVSVEIYNSTSVDLCVYGKSQRDCKEIRPKQVGRVAIRSEQWIRFGMEAHRYNVPRSLFKAGLKLQAEPDGKIYLIPDANTLPAATLPKQPSGFPLAPTRKADLT